jgi:Brain and reproductive organ-expressed protein (BRE)
VKSRVCGSVLEWEFLLVSVPADDDLVYVDVTPILSSFVGRGGLPISYDPYTPISDKAVVSLMEFKRSRGSTTDDIIERLHVLAKALEDAYCRHQWGILFAAPTDALTSRQFNNREITFILDIMRSKEDLLTTVCNSGLLYNIMFEFRLTDGAFLHSQHDSEYITNILAPEGIRILLSLSFDDTLETDKIRIGYELLFPKGMVALSWVPYSKHEEDANIFELLSQIETALLANWRKRKAFVQELVKLSASLEYDAIDFSYISIAVRLKRNKLITLCSIEFRLGADFPQELPKIAFVDLMNSQSHVVIVDTSSWDPSLWTTADGAGAMSKLLLSKTIDIIEQQAFE